MTRPCAARATPRENLIELLERRLDAVVYRMKFAITPFASRQFVNHGHVTVNGKRVNIPSYLVRDGDEIEVREKSKQLAVVLDAAQSGERDVPDYLEVDHRAMKGRFGRAPKLTDVPYPVHDGAEPGGRVLLAVIHPHPALSR